MSESNNQHARLGPSDSARWTRCAGAIKATMGIPDTSGPAAEEGTAAHELLEVSLLSKKPPSHYLGETYNGYQMDESFIANIKPVWEFVLNRADGGKLHPERRVNPGLLMGRDDCWGTGDVTILHPGVIEIWDLKYGRGITVEPEDNTQLILYAIGVIADLMTTDPMACSGLHTITCGIMQPRIANERGPFRSVSYTMAEIQDHLQELTKAAAKTDLENPPRNPGAKQCQWCKAKRDCREHADFIISTNNLPGLIPPDLIESHVVAPVDSLSGQELAAVLSNADMLIAWVKAVEEHCQEMLMDGTAPTEVSSQFKVIRKQANQKFREEDQEVLVKQLTNKRLKRSEIFTEKLKTPGQILQAAEASEAVKPKSIKNLKAMIYRPDGKLKVVPIAAKGEAVVTEVKDAFAEYIQER